MQKVACSLIAVFLILGVLCSAPPISASKPSAPEFTLKYVDSSYDVEPVYDTDQYTGKTVVIHEGYHVRNNSIIVTIENQAFSNYQDSNGNRIFLAYNIRWKGPFGQSWTEISSYLGGIYVTASNSLTQKSGGVFSLVSPNAPYTVVPFDLAGNNGSNVGILLHVPDEGKVEFQVEALIGYYVTVQVTPTPAGPRGSEYHIFHGETSGWSPTQTITIHSQDQPASSATPSASHGTQTPLATETSSENPLKVDWMQTATLVLLGAIVVLLLFVVYYLRKRSRPLV